MTMATVGRNTLEAEALRGFVERLEHIDAQKRDLADDRKVIMAEAIAAGYVPKAITYVLKVRAAKPHDRAEWESLRDLYLHAMGLDDEPPLFRAVGLINVDIHARQSVIEAMKRLVPAEGEIIVKVGGTAERLWRDKDGAVHSETVTAPPAADTGPLKAAHAAAKDKPPVPDVDEAGAFALGVEAAKENKPVISNPFPFGDPRRARYDEGWRKGNGGDGMGPG